MAAASPPPRGRTTIKGTHRVTKKYARASVTNEQKMNAVRLVRENGMAAAIRELYPSLGPTQAKSKRRQVYRWVESAADIEFAIAAGKGDHRKHRQCGHSAVLPPVAEEQLVFWINDMRAEGLPVSPMMLTLQARQVAFDYGVSSEVFSASWSWRKRFLRQHQMSLGRRTRVGQRTPVDAQQVAIAFGATVRDAVATNKCVAVFNAAQTALNYEYLPTHTINGKGERTAWIRSSGVEKSRMTVMLLADAEGKKRAPFAVLKQKPSTVPLTQAANVESQHGFGRGVWAEASRLMEETGIHIYGNNKGWWNASLSVLFLRFHFGSRGNIDNNILLLWDDFSGHWTEEVRAYAASINVVLLKIPPGYTAVCQPADVAWMKPLKLQLRGEWVADVEKQLHEHRRTTSTGAFKMIAPKRATVISWLDRCWRALSTETVRSGLKNLLLSSHEDVCSGEPVSGCGVSDLVSSLSALNVCQDMGSDIECD